MLDEGECYIFMNADLETERQHGGVGKTCIKLESWYVLLMKPRPREMKRP
jgi:hypothetical protein